MFNRMMIVGALLLGVLMFSATVSAAEPKADAKAEEKAAAWGTDYEAAIAKAKADKKIVLADFTGSDWCGFCIKLKADVFDTKAFQDWAAKEFVLLELDFPRKTQQPDALKKQNKKLKDQYKVGGFPTVLLLDGEGKELGRVVGYPGKEKWLEQVKGIIDKIAPKKPAADK